MKLHWENNIFEKKNVFFHIVPLVPIIFGLPIKVPACDKSSASAFAKSSFTSMSTNSEASLWKNEQKLENWKIIVKLTL